MSEEMTLPESLERLEISPESCQCHITRAEDDHLPKAQTFVSSSESIENPEYLLENLSLTAFCPKGNCLCNKKRDRTKIFKRLANKRILRRSKLSRAVLRAPVLRLPGAINGELSGPGSSDGARSLASRLLESNVSSKLKEEDGSSGASSRMPSPALKEHKTQTCCSVQARLMLDASPPAPPVPDDTSMDELASYFDIFVHIPKKMSRMAEMMYI